MTWPRLLTLVVVVGLASFVPAQSAARSYSGSEASVANSTAHGIEAVESDRNLRIRPQKSSAWTLDLTLLDYDGIEGSVTSSGEGILQGLRIPEAPAGAKPHGSLAIRLTLSGNLVPKLRESGETLDLYLEGVPVLRYELLRAADEDGNELPMHLALEAHDHLTLVLERVVSYPITIQALIASAKGARPERSPGTEASHPEAAPANDTCAGAAIIPASGPFPYTTPAADITDATTTGDPVPQPSCVFPGDTVTRSVWYQITPAQAGSYRFSTCQGTSTCLGDSGSTVDDPILAVYTSVGGCAGLFTQVPGACDDDGCDQRPFQAYLETTLLAGVTYYVVAWNAGPDPIAGHTSLRLRVDRPGTPPPNDTCTGGSAPAYTIPSVVPANGYLTPVTDDVTDAGSAGDPLLPPSCLSAGFSATRSTWYTFAPAVSGSYRISSCATDAPGSTLDDTLIALYTSVGGCLGPFLEVPTLGGSDGCDDDSCGFENLQAVLNTQLTAGTTYYVVVYKVGAAPPGCDSAVQLRVTQIVPPPNDQCASAIALALDTPVSSSTENAADDYRSTPTSACFSGVGQTTATSAGSDVVYRFTAPSTDLYSFKATGYATSRNLVLYVAGDCPQGASPQTPACLAGANRNSSSSSEEVACLSLSAEETVWVYVDDTGTTGGSPFTLEVNRCQIGTEPASTPVKCGIEGNIFPPADVDFYELGTPASGSRIFSLVDGVAGNTTDFDLRVTTDVDTLEYDDLNADLPFGALSGTCDGTPLTGVISYLRVSAFSSQAVAEPYRLYSVLEPPISSAVAESDVNSSNDVPAGANQSALGYFSGTLSGTSPSNDVDWYRFDAAAGALILVGLDGDPLRDQTPLDASLALFDDPSAAPLVSVDDGDGTSLPASGTRTSGASNPRSPGEALTWRARTTGTYYVKVAKGQLGTTPRAGDYLLAISTGCNTTSDDPDGDGVAGSLDCAPNDPGAFAIPGEATGLRIGPAKQALSWVAAEGGSVVVYDVLRGLIGALPVGPGSADESCFDNLPATSMSDTTNPNLGQGFWYVVRGVDACGANPDYGTEGRLGAAGPARTSTTCP